METKSDLSWVTEVREAVLPEEANKLLQDGWTLIAVHQRTLSGGSGGGLEFFSRYIFGRAAP